MARWRGRGRRDLSDDELLDAAEAWLQAHPPQFGDGGADGGVDATWRAWRDQFEAWLAEHGTDHVELERLKMRRYVGRLRWKVEAEGRVWGGVDVPAWPPAGVSGG